MFKYQWYDTKGKLHEFKEKEIQHVEFNWDLEAKKATQGPDIEINIDLGGIGPKVEPKNLPYNIKQFKDFDQATYYEPIILERINDKLMVQVNNGFDSKLKVYVPLGAQPAEYGYGMGSSPMEIIRTLIFGGGEAGKKYSKVYVKKGDEIIVCKKPSIFGALITGKFVKKEFTKMFGDNEEVMALYPKKMKRKYELLPEYIWVYNQK